MRIKVEYDPRCTTVTMNRDGIKDHAGAIYHTGLRGIPEVCLTGNADAVSTIVHGGDVDMDDVPNDDGLTTTYARSEKPSDVHAFLHLTLQDAADLRDKLDAILRAAKRDPRYDNLFI